MLSRWWRSRFAGNALAPRMLLSPWPPAAAASVALAVEPWNALEAGDAVFYLVRYAFDADNQELPALAVVTRLGGNELHEMETGINERLAAILTDKQHLVLSFYSPTSDAGRLLAAQGTLCRIRSVEEATT